MVRFTCLHHLDSLDISVLSLLMNPEICKCVVDVVHSQVKSFLS